MQDYIISRFNSFSLDKRGFTREDLLNKSKKDFRHIQGSKTLVIILPSRGQPLWTWKRVINHVIKSGDSCLTYEFPGVIFADPKMLVDCLEVINNTVRDDIKMFKERYGFERCVLVCLSLASTYGSMVYKDNSDINKAIMIVPGENIAKDVWYGHRTQHLRKYYEKNAITLSELEEQWYKLAPIHNMPAQGTEISLHYGGKDTIIPYKYSKDLIEVLKKNNVDVLAKVYGKSGHYLISYRFLIFPKSFLKY